ncbi:putative nuclease [plant metagenome]|uniref:Putative nuclease n=2 Tax=plant metagenome TaxID=1297885 RepID=A0A484RVN2_9ZZZZ
MMQRRPRGARGPQPFDLSRILRAPRRSLVGLLSALALAGLAWLLPPGWLPESGGRAPAGQDRPTTTTPAGEYVLQGKVSSVADGDTVTLQVGGSRHRVRLASIDAPETGKEGKAGQPYGQASRRALSDMVAGRDVRARCFEKDQYDRDICDLELPEGPTVNRRMVESGMAWANRQGRDQHLRDRALIGLEQSARDARLGLWADAKPEQPWAWRYACRQRGDC